MTEGTISGLALARIRSDVGLTQDHLAEAVGSRPDTVKGWETGRRPLTRTKAGSVARLRFRLRSLGADTTRVQLLDAALRADDLLDQILRPDPHRHVLAHEVLTRRTCDLLMWPLTGRPPRELGGQRGHPRLGAVQRRQIHDALRDAAGRARGERSPMIRRQAAFLLATDPDATDDLRHMAAVEVRRRPALSHWTPAWPVARGLAIAQAVAGDPEPLRDFLAYGCVTDSTLTANLVYYLHYSGELTTEYESDDFMATDPGGWRGDVLLRTLADGLAPATPHVELVVRTVRTLIDRRPGLLGDRPLMDEVGRRVRALLDAHDGALAPTTHDELTAVRRLIDSSRRA